MACPRTTSRIQITRLWIVIGALALWSSLCSSQTPVASAQPNAFARLANLHLPRLEGSRTVYSSEGLKPLATQDQTALVNCSAWYSAQLHVTVPMTIAEDPQLESMEMRGTVGSYKVGLNYTVRANTVLVQAHYFYVSQLKNIPLQGAVKGESIDLKGADGSAFHLHFVGNGSSGSDPLTFYNSVGVRGSWVLGSRTLPVDLSIQHSTANPGERMYAQVTSRADADFESMVKTTQEAILSGNRMEAAKHMHYPLRVNGTRHPLLVSNPAELIAKWPVIFTPAFLARLKEDVPHEMFVRNGEAMLGDGELWFDEAGIVTINPVLDK